MYMMNVDKTYVVCVNIVHECVDAPVITLIRATYTYLCNC